MNITELDSYNLADAVKFNEQLNPRIWQGDKMKPQVREKLLQIAQDFKQSLGLSDLDVKDITVSGSNAGYTYTPNSDIDLHLVVDIPQADSDEVYRELFDAKKFQYNETHNITIGGYDVELYVENANTPPVSQGMYSVVKDDWINIPKKRRSTVNDNAVKSKYDVIKHRIESAIASGNFKRLTNTAAKIKKMRQAGLDKHGELGPENLAYKMLRTQGVIKALYDARTAAQDKKLSLKEQPKRARVTYGFREDVGITPDGVSPSTKMFLSETDDEQTVSDFIKDTAEFLGIKHMPKINLHSDAEWGEQNQSFGRFDPETNELHVNLANRHIMDVLRTTAHELAHCKQHEISELPMDAGKTGSPWENEAHAVAGIVMRNYADKHPEMFQGVDLNENASGYIPKNKKEAKDPRYSMALSVDIKPGQVGKEANKLGLQTDSQGKPALLMKTANTLAESLAEDFKKFNKSKGEEEPWDRDGYEPPGPEFPPEMPAGTTKVDVSDLTDWYRLGMDISDMDDADPEDYNQGPPQTVMVFPSDELEQSYLKQFKRLGLKTHDMDPDVEGGEDTTGKHLNKALAEELEAFKAQDLFEVKMTSKNLANLAKDIKGAKVGLEFEMIVPNVSNDEDGDQEPDYDQDERVRDIDDAVNFFDDGDYNSSREIRRLREQMESDYFDWQTEQIDQDWHNHGFEFFMEYMDREEPFDPEDYQERAEDEVKADYPDLDPTSEDFGELVAEKLREINAEYYNETWQMEGRGYDNAREEFEDEKRDEYTESAWLDDRGIRFASDVQNEYSDVQWPYWSSVDGGEGDIESVALDFMNAMGMDSVAISSSYHGSYKKWVGNGWVSIGSNKPDDCFTIEPDGSLEGDDSSDTGLEFVSPPIPLEDIGTVMSKVQNWAGNYGAYTGNSNKTSIHTNISVPGYDLKNLDYLKAALLLGDEYVLREFDRIGNSYAAPAIEKVKSLVKQNPDKAKELLDKMKSQLNAEASKLIHSGQTNKFTSINTKDNRVEFRSPGGDYLSIIADNPQKMVDTINRMVVTLDAAMDPNKYKEEYQKKLYKVLTGQAGGREAATGKKQEMKKDDKDLLNIFSRYAAGELPKAALKSFVRQAQLQRKVAKDKLAPGKYWWNATQQGRDNGRIEVVGKDEKDAKMAAAKAWGFQPTDSVLNGISVEVLRPYEEKPEEQPAQQGNRTYRITTTGGGLIAGDEYGDDQTALQRAQYWAQRRGVDVVVRNPQGEEVGRVSASGEITPAARPQQTTQQGPTLNGRPSNPDGNFIILRTGTTTPAYRFMAADGDDAQTVLDQWRQENPGSWHFSRDTDRVFGQPEESQPIAGSTLDLQRQRAAAAQGSGQYGIWIQASDRFARVPADQAAGNPNTLRTFPNREAAEEYLTTTRANTVGMRNDIEVREIPQGYELPAPLGRPVSPAFRGQDASTGVDTRVDYEIYNRATGAVIDTFQARNDDEAMVRLDDYRAHGNHGYSRDMAEREYGVRRGPGVTNTAQQSSVNNLTPHGPGPWEVASRRNNQVYYNTAHTNRNAAETEARTWIQQMGLDPAEFEVRTREGVAQAPNWEIRDGSTNRLVHQFYAPNYQQAAIISSEFYDDNDFAEEDYELERIGSSADAAQGGIVDVAGEQPATAPQTLTRPGQVQQVFTGTWLVKNENTGEELYRLSGIGNSQADANRYAAIWARRYGNGAPIEVVPEMGEA